MAKRFGGPVSYGLVGDVFAAAGRREEALEAYHKTVTIAETLATAQPGIGLSHLAVGYSKVGDMLVATGRRKDGVEAFRKTMLVFEELASLDRGNAQLQIDFAVSIFKLASAGDNSHKRYSQALKIFRQLDAEGKLASHNKGWINTIERAMTSLPR